MSPMYSTEWFDTFAAGRRCMHEIRYPNGQVDDIQFDVFQPEEIRDLCRHAGLEPQIEMARWSPELCPSADFPRYQLICLRQ